MGIASGLGRRATLATFLALLSSSSVSAFSYGFSPLDRGLSVFSRLFDFPSLQSDAVATGVARFAFFLIIFALLNYSARKFVFKETAGGGDSLNKRTANVVSFIIAAISAFFVPSTVVLAGATGYAAIIWTLITLGPAIGALLYAFGGKQEERSCGAHVMALVFLLIAWLWSGFMTENVTRWAAERFPQVVTYLETVNSWMFLVAFIAFIVQIFRVFSRCGSGGGGAGAGGSGPGSGRSPTEPRPEPPRTPEEPADFSERIARLQELHNAFSDQLNQFFAAGNALLTTNQAFLSSLGGYGVPSPAVSADQWDAFLQGAHQLGRIRTAFDDHSRSIVGDRRYAEIPDDQRRTASQCLLDMTNAYVRLEAYQHDFTGRFSRGEGPA